MRLGFDDTLNNIRPVRGHGDAGVLRLGSAQPMVHSCLRRCLCARFSLRFHAGSLAVRTGRGYLVGSRGTTLGEGTARQLIWRWPSSRAYPWRRSSSILGSMLPPLMIATFVVVFGSWSRRNRQPATATAQAGAAAALGFATRSPTD